MTGEEIYKINVQIRSIRGLDLFELPLSSYLLVSLEKILTDCVVKRSGLGYNLLPSSSADTENSCSEQSLFFWCQTQPLTVSPHKS